MAFGKIQAKCGLGMDVVSCRLYLAIVVVLTFSSTLSLRADPIASYEEYCHEFLEDKGHPGRVSSSLNVSDLYLGFHRAFFTGGFPFFDPNVTQISFRRPYKSAFLGVRNATLNSDKDRSRIVVDASLLLRNRSSLWLRDRSRVFRHTRARRDPFLRPGGLRLNLKGVWSPHSGVLCMAGCFMQDSPRNSNASDCKVKAVFHYPLVNTIHQPLVKGSIQSMRYASDPLFFEPISITAIYGAPFVSKEDAETGEIPAMVHANVPQHVNVWKDDTAVCEFHWSDQPLTVVWDRQCKGQDCSPFKAVERNTRSILLVENMMCSGGRVHGFFVFRSNLFMPVEGLVSTVYEFLAIEGVWNSLTGQLSARGCYLEGVTNSSWAYESKDCDIVITLQFPITLELTFRYSVLGRVERRSGSTLPSFKPFLFTGGLNIHLASIERERSPPLEYAYTAEKITQATSKCQSSSLGQPIRSKIGKKTLKFPDGQNFGDLGFPAIFKVSSGSSNVEAQFSPLSINQRTNMDYNPSLEVVASSIASHEKGSLNVSFDVIIYDLNIEFLNNTSSNLFPAEGVYDPNKGLLCLIACRSLAISRAQGMSKIYDGVKDCEIHITVLLPPTNPGYFDKHQVNGQISSLRDQKDPLWFSPVDITSGSLFYQLQAADALIQMDFEIVMGIIALTVAILSIGLQLHHVKKYPKVLPHISLVMLFILILGHFIPLVLNFEAIFTRMHPQNIRSWSGGWVEINEVIVRVMTMIVFLLLLRLLYLSWDTKCKSVTSGGPWCMEKKVLRVCLTAYGLAGLTALIVYHVNGSNFPDILKGFSGLTIDFFLFPQVVGNYVWEVHDRILSYPFFIGMTFVRTLPHVYDVVRKLEFFLVREGTYYFANPSWDFYSNVWNVVIPSGGLILAVLVFCQQRCGGAFFSIASWRQRRVYNQVSTDST